MYTNHGRSISSCCSFYVIEKLNKNPFIILTTRNGAGMGDSRFYHTFAVYYSKFVVKNSN
jgi:hypothetical protein